MTVGYPACWNTHRTKASVLEQMGTKRELLNNVKRRKLRYFGHMTRAYCSAYSVHIFSKAE